MASNFAILLRVLAVYSIILIVACTLIFSLTGESKTAGDNDRVKPEIVDTPLVEPETPKPETFLMHPTPRSSITMNISLMIVYTNGTSLDDYATALNSVECYAKLHSYQLYLFPDSEYEECEKHKDLFFRRHCCIAQFMQWQLEPDSWLLVLDADIAVINPNILLERYIDPAYEITLFDRFFNFEVGANSYLVKNTERGRDFVQRFADYEFKLPESFHGTDNGALHPFLAERLAPGNSRIVDSLCDKIWRESKNYGNLYEMEACARLIFGDRTHFAEQKLRILPKGTAWVRDLWLLKSRWAQDDFMLHAVKEKQLEKLGPKIKKLSENQLYQWDPTAGNMHNFPLLQKLDIDKCEGGKEEWRYDSRLMISTEKKAKLLDHMETKIFKQRLETIGRLGKMMRAIKGAFSNSIVLPLLASLFRVRNL